MPNLSGLVEATLFVRNLPRARDFYQQVVGRTPGGDVPACLVGVGESLGAGHIAFAVTAAELDGWRARLESNGVEVLSEVAWELGGRSLYFRDPDGHLLEFATPGLWGLDG